MPVPSNPVDLLLPRPREVEIHDSAIDFPRSLRVSAAEGTDTDAVASALAPALPSLQRAVPDCRAGATKPGPDRVLLSLATGGGASPESYTLEFTPEGALVSAPAPAGLFYGLVTLAQWFLIHGEPGAGTIPGVSIRDFPDFADRGVLLDISRDRVPRMATLYQITDRLASWKINQLQLYSEHTFAYPGHEIVWRGSSPMTAEQVRSLDVYCRERFIQLVPNQNSFGHLHRWLKHMPYRHLAECPEGIDHPFSDDREPYGLCPTDPASLEFLSGLYDDLLPCFESDLFNVGCDETIDLGRCRSAEACAERGRQTVYRDFLSSIRALLDERGKRMQFWADILLEEGAPPDLDSRVIPLVWGYEASHPFDRELERIESTGTEFYVCPGTSSWNSFAGRWSNARANLAAAARTGLATGATGYLITDWGDNGHLQPLPVSYPGLLCGAALAWSAESTGAAASPDWAALLDRHAFDVHPGRGPGASLLALADAYRATGVDLKNSTVLFWLLLDSESALSEPRFDGLTASGLEGTQREIHRAREALEQVDASTASLDLVVSELRWVAELLAFACDVGQARVEHAPDKAVSALPADARRRLDKALGPLIEAHRPLWLARSRPGGRQDSVRRLEKLRSALNGDYSR